MPQKRTDSRDQSESEGSECSEIAAPDGGYGWVIVLAAFIINCIADGVTLSCGILFVEFRDYFQDSYGKTAFITSLFSGLPMFIGPFGCFLIEIYDCRKVTFAGSLTAAFGFILSAFSPNIEFLCLSLGVVAAFGMSLLFVPATIVVTQYFDRRLALATGISTSGSGLGTFIFPPLITYLIEEYAFSGTLIILGGILLNGCVCAAFFRPLNICRSVPQPHAVPNMAKTPAWTAERGAMLEGALTVENHNLRAAHRSLLCLPEHSSSEFCQRRWMLAPQDASQADLRSRGAGRRTFHRSELLELPPPMDRHAVAIHRARRAFLHVHQHHLHQQQPFCHLHQNFVDSSLQSELHLYPQARPQPLARPQVQLQLQACASCPELALKNASNVSYTVEELLSPPRRHRSYGRTLKRRFLRFWAMILDRQLLTDWKFVIFFLSNFILYAWYDLPYLYLPDFVHELRLSETKSSWLMSILGGMNTIGQVVVGYLGDLPCVDCVLLYAVWIVITGLSNFFVNYLFSFSSLVAYVSVFGFFVSANYSLCSVIIVNLFGMQKLTKAYGLLLIGQGVSNSVFPPIIGFLRDYSGSYTSSFYLTGFSIVISGLMLLPIYIRKSR